MCRADKVAFATLMRDFLVSLREYNCDQWTQASLSLQALILKSPLYVPLCSKGGRALTFQNVACSLRHSKKRLHGKRCVCIHCVCVCVCACVARARVYGSLVSASNPSGVSWWLPSCPGGCLLLLLG